jgi:hypothetical protein
VGAGTAQATTPSPAHPIYVQPEAAPATDAARRLFQESAARLGMAPLQIAEAPSPEKVHFAARVETARALTAKLSFAEARPQLDSLVAEVLAAGGGDLDAHALSDLYVTRAWARSGATFRGDLPPPEADRTAAYQDLVRAAILEPTRILNEQQYPPAVVEDGKRASAEVLQQPTGTVTIKGNPTAIAYLDGGPGRACPATFENVRFGEHVLRVEETSHGPWGIPLPVTTATVDVDVPARPVLTLSDSEAASYARKMAKPFALVADPEIRQSQVFLGLRLVDAQGHRRDASTVPLDRAVANGTLDAALLQLDNDARSLSGSAPSPVGVAPLSATTQPLPGPAPASATPAPVLVTQAPNPTFQQDPLIWARDHWPVVAAVGAFVVVGVVLAVAVSHD